MGLLNDWFQNQSQAQQSIYNQQLANQQYYNQQQQQAYRPGGLADALNQQLYDQLLQHGIDSSVLLDRLGKVKPLPKLSPDPKGRIAEIDKELDIIRGRVPTPKGYKINPHRAKALMTERRELEKLQ